MENNIYSLKNDDFPNIIIFTHTAMESVVPQTVREIKQMSTKHEGGLFLVFWTAKM